MALKVLSNIPKYFTKVFGRMRSAKRCMPESGKLPGEAYKTIFWGSVLCIGSNIIHFFRNLYIYLTVQQYTQMFLNSYFEVLGFVVGTLAVITLFFILIRISKKNQFRDIRPKRYFRIALVGQVFIFIHIAALIAALYISIKTMNGLPVKLIINNCISLFKNLLSTVGLINIVVGCFDFITLHGLSDMK